MPELRDGTLTYTTAFGALALTVRDGVIVDCQPDRHGLWIGLDAGDVWRGAKHWGVEISWHEASNAHDNSSDTPNHSDTPSGVHPNGGRVSNSDTLSPAYS